MSNECILLRSNDHYCLPEFNELSTAQFKKLSGKLKMQTPVDFGDQQAKQNSTFNIESYGIHEVVMSGLNTKQSTIFNVATETSTGILRHSVETVFNYVQYNSKKFGLIRCYFTREQSIVIQREDFTELRNFAEVFKSQISGGSGSYNISRGVSLVGHFLYFIEHNDRLARINLEELANNPEGYEIEILKERAVAVGVLNKTVYWATSDGTIECNGKKWTVDDPELIPDFVAHKNLLSILAEAHGFLVSNLYIDANHSNRLYLFNKRLKLQHSMLFGNVNVEDNHRSMVNQVRPFRLRKMRLIAISLFSIVVYLVAIHKGKLWELDVLQAHTCNYSLRSLDELSLCH